MNTWWTARKNNRILFPEILARFRKYGSGPLEMNCTHCNYDELEEYVQRKKRLERERNKRLRTIASSKEVRRGK